MSDSDKLSLWLLKNCPQETNKGVKWLKIRILRWAGQRWFWAFCLTMKPWYMLTRFHWYLCWELQKMYETVRDGKDENIIIEVQPQIGKSTTTSELFPAWVLGKQAWPMICASYGASLAEVKSSNCRDVVSSDAYHIVFPRTRLHPETAAKDYWKTTTGGSYRAVGVGGGLTGMPGKILIADDLFKDSADAESETIRESTWKWWQTVFLSRKQSKSGVVLVNTRWHRDDVAGRVEEAYKQDLVSGKPLNEFDHWKQFTFPAFATEDEYIDGKLFRKSGEVLCPERFTYEDMVKRRNSTEVYEWSALYMQTPIMKENAKFRENWFKYYEPKDIKFKQLNYYTTVDLASSKKKGADNVVVRTIGKERTTGYWFFMEETAGHLDPGQTVDAIFLQVSMYPGTKVWVESVAYQATLEYWIMEKQRKDQVYFEVNQLVPKQTKSKEDRIEGLIPLYKAGIIFHRIGLDKEYEAELLAFPQGKHDDRIDVVSMALDVVPNTMVLETPEQKKARLAEERAGFDPFSAFNKI